MTKELFKELSITVLALLLALAAVLFGGKAHGQSEEILFLPYVVAGPTLQFSSVVGPTVTPAPTYPAPPSP